MVKKLNAFFVSVFSAEDGKCLCTPDGFRREIERPVSD